MVGSARDDGILPVVGCKRVSGGVITAGEKQNALVQRVDDPFLLREKVVFQLRWRGDPVAGADHGHGFGIPAGCCQGHWKNGKGYGKMIDDRSEIIREALLC